MLKLSASVSAQLLVLAAAHAAGGWPQPAALTTAAGRHPALAAKPGLVGAWTKVGRALREVVAELDQDGAARGAVAASTIRDPGLRMREDGRAHVTLRVASLTPGQSALLRARGLEPTFESAQYGFVEGWVSPAALERLAELDFVTSVQPTVAPVTSTGGTLSAGDAILRADQARQTFGVSGQGETVGVMSDSVDGIDSAVATGDLPPGVQVLEFGQGAGEGTAMLEIVHDLAPGASLAFYGPASSGDMITGMSQLAAAGARVIVDDLTFFDQPHFEEGPIAQAVDALAAQGIVYVTSSGNFAANDADRGHYEAVFDDAGALGSLQHVHRFGPGTVAQSIVVLPGSVARIFLQWANPFGQSGDDYDLYVFDDSSPGPIAVSDDPQDGNDLPVEQVTLDARSVGSPVELFVVINRFSGTARQFELYYAGGITAISPHTPAGSIAGHANAAGAITVGTINADDPGNDTIAPYSSQGPCDLFFPAPEARAKPDVTGIDGVAVTGAAGFPSPFFGTSAAAPHVAALAALVRQAAPGASAGQVKQVLQSTAVDLGAPGFDFVFGAGRADALAAVSAALAVATTTTTTTAPSTTTSTSSTLPNRPPVITSLAAVLDGNVATLTGAAVDPDADVVAWRATIRDGAGTLLGDTGLVSFDAGLPAEATFTLGVSGLEQFPTATVASLVLQDAAGGVSEEQRADFGQADPGGPQIASASFRRRAKRLKLVGSGFVPRRTRVEVNGVTLSRTVKVKRGSRATVRGGARALGLQAGPNRIRLLTDGARSNIVVVER
jgi:hypothetical protein